MKHFCLLFVFVFSVIYSYSQEIPVLIEKAPREGNRTVNDTISRRSGKSTSNKGIKNLEAKIEQYKIISHQNDTIIVDTTLTIYKEYKFNYLRKDEFDLLPFANIGQTYNTLSYNFNETDLMPRFGSRARHFNHIEIEDVNYYYVPTPFTELMYKTAFEQGQLLDAFFTVNMSPEFNFSIAYKGLRSLGNYQHTLTSTGNFRFTSNFKTLNDKYHARAHIVMQDQMNEENGGIKDEDIVNFELGNPEFIDRSVFDPNFEDADGILVGKRFHLDHFYNLIKTEDSISSNSLSIGNIISYKNKFYRYTQTSVQDQLFGEAFNNDIQDRTNLENFYGEANATYMSNTLGSIKANVGYSQYNYGYSQIVQVEGNTITNRLKGNIVSVGGEYKNTFGKFLIHGKFGLNVSGDFEANFFEALARFKLNDDLRIVSTINLNSRLPNYNYLLYQSDYLKYNWQNNFQNVETKQLAFNIYSDKLVNLELDFNTITNYAFFQKNIDGNTKPFQNDEAINYFRVKVSKEISFKNLALNNTIRYQQVIDGEGILNVPEFITRNTLYYSNHLFKKALYLQTGVTFSYFSRYNMNAYDPVLGEFYVQNENNFGSFPRLDFFLNVKVRQTRIYLKAEHFNSSFTGYNYYSAPNEPYRDFVVRFGLVWNFFL